MKKTIYIMQNIWLAIAVFALITGIYYLAKLQIKDALAFFVITFIGGLLFKINKNRVKKYFS